MLLIKNFSFTGRLLLIAFFFTLFFSCKDNTKETITPEPIIYMAGIESGYNKPVVKYWSSNDTLPVILTDGKYYASATSMFVTDKDVYVVGSNNNFATYWKNRTEVTLAEGIITDIDVKGLDVYMVGSVIKDSKNIATYWKNDVEVKLTNDSYSSHASAVFVAGTDIYICGSHFNSLGNDVATYWKNGVEVSLTDGKNIASAKDIFVDGSDVYVAGYEYNGKRFVAKYWKNGNEVILDSKSDDITAGYYANSIAVANNNVYIVGHQNTRYDQTATYWKNGVLQPFLDGLNFNSYAYCVKVVGDDVYIVLSGLGSSGTKYWKNGTINTFTNIRTSSNNIFIK